MCHRRQQSGISSGVLSLSLLAAAISPFVYPLAARGQEPKEGGFQLPGNPAMWVNSKPITSEGLKGKAAVLWFYEEGCPRCRERWPNLIAISKKFEGKPVLFIAVNSGTSRGEVEQYASDVGVPWPIIVDASRELEMAAGIGQISLQNIYQLGVISPDGRFSRGDASKMEEAAARVVAGAKWTVDPTGIPPALQPAWHAIEFGEFATAGPLVKKGLASKKEEIQAGAAKLNDGVQERIKEQLASAQKIAENGSKWQIYKAYYELGKRFAGFSLPEEVEAKKSELAGDEQVKKELAALKALEGIKRGFGSTSPNARRTAVSRLKKLAQDFPETDAAKEAQAILSSWGG